VHHYGFFFFLVVFTNLFEEMSAIVARLCVLERYVRRRNSKDCSDGHE